MTMVPLKTVRHNEYLQAGNQNPFSQKELQSTLDAISLAE
jgi:hypothetical protein